MEKTAVEWLTFHWMELDKKYYGGEIGRIDYRNRRDAIQVEAKEMEKQQIIDFAIWFECTNTSFQSYETIIEQYYNETFK
jgi:hypothetical protein